MNLGRIKGLGGRSTSCPRAEEVSAMLVEQYQAGRFKPKSSHHQQQKQKISELSAENQELRAQKQLLNEEIQVLGERVGCQDKSITERDELIQALGERVGCRDKAIAERDEMIQSSEEVKQNMFCDILHLKFG